MIVAVDTGALLRYCFYMDATRTAPIDPLLAYTRTVAGLHTRDLKARQTGDHRATAMINSLYTR